MEGIKEGVDETQPLKNVSKLDLKRAQIMEERKRRLINRGVSLDKVDEELAKEDWKNLPLEKKVEALELKVSAIQQNMVRFVSGAVEGLRRDITSLQHNDTVIADALDINLIALATCLELAGVSKEKQGEIVIEVQKGLQEAEKKKAEAEKAAAETKLVEIASEKEVIGKEVETTVETPTEATVFEG